MPYANNEGIRLYYEVEGQGPPLVLQHGRAGALQGWREVGYVEALKDDYRLILVDARGHGRSDKPHDPQAYGMALWVADVVAVLDNLGIDKAHFLGYSMGGWIGWGMAKYAPQRLSSLIIGGKHAYEADPDGPNPRKQSIQLFRQGMEAFVAAMKSLWGPWWTPAVEAIIRGNDLEALIAQYTLRERVGLVDALPSLTVPCLIFIGENDGQYSNAKKESKLIINATFISLPDLDHVGASCRSDLVLPHIRRFLAGVSEV